MRFTLFPIGFVTSSRTAVEDDHWDNTEASIELVDEVSADALQGLDDFSHAMVVFIMHQIRDGETTKCARHPRDRADLPKVGIFAQRGSNRPNRIGVTVCRIIKMKDRCVWVEGLDAIDGTPVIDIKPWVAEFGPRGTVHQPEWMTELMTRYWC